MQAKSVSIGLGLMVLAGVPGLVRAADAPVAWGLTSGARHCVIFQESKKTTGAFFIVAATLKTVGKLDVVEVVGAADDGFTFTPTTYVEDQATMNDLQTRALHERLRFVKIPAHYSPELLQAARDLCKTPDLLKADASASSSQ